MRLSLFLIACTLLSSAMAVPVKPGTNKKPKDPNREIPDARPGDVVLFNSHDVINGDGKINGHGSSERRTHPGIVVQHDDDHVVHVAPIGHVHPGGVPTVPAAPLGIPDNNGPGLIAVGTPKQVHQSDIKPLGEPRKGSVPMPARLEEEHFNTLQQHIAANKPPAQEPAAKDKGKKKEKEKRGLERRELVPIPKKSISGFPLKKVNERREFERRSSDPIPTKSVPGFPLKKGNERRDLERRSPNPIPKHSSVPKSPL